MRICSSLPTTASSRPTVLVPRTFSLEIRVMPLFLTSPIRLWMVTALLSLVPSRSPQLL